MITVSQFGNLDPKHLFSVQFYDMSQHHPIYHFLFLCFACINKFWYPAHSTRPKSSSNRRVRQIRPKTLAWHSEGRSYRPCNDFDHLFGQISIGWVLGHTLLDQDWNQILHAEWFGSSWVIFCQNMTHPTSLGWSSLAIFASSISLRSKIQPMKSLPLEKW